MPVFRIDRELKVLMFSESQPGNQSGNKDQDKDASLGNILFAVREFHPPPSSLYVVKFCGLEAFISKLLHNMKVETQRDTCLTSNSSTQKPNEHDLWSTACLSGFAVERYTLVCGFTSGYQGSIHCVNTIARCNGPLFFASVSVRFLSHSRTAYNLNTGYSIASSTMWFCVILGIYTELSQAKRQLSSNRIDYSISVSTPRFQAHRDSLNSRAPDLVGRNTVEEIHALVRRQDTRISRADMRRRPPALCIPRSDDVVLLQSAVTCMTKASLRSLNEPSSLRVSHRYGHPGAGAPDTLVSASLKTSTTSMEAVYSTEPALVDEIGLLAAAAVCSCDGEVGINIVCLGDTLCWVADSSSFVRWTSGTPYAPDSSLHVIALDARTSRPRSRQPRVSPFISPSSSPSLGLHVPFPSWLLQMDADRPTALRRTFLISRVSASLARSIGRLRVHLERALISWDGAAARKPLAP
ncbi:hypothetical protein R3P38DRAFT_2780044 [Favolaschia claudopus]|uniref:Uncharacterized protein n=1 Tax=Favolaschia claudopus TaxID=2862362 RepID=A0AAW0BB19_9AGAR